jgi:serine/threonine protein kinase
MSPEQARGDDVDKRTDIWAFGCVLYEALTGQRAFGGESAAGIIASVMKAEPDYSLLPETTPPLARSLLRRCFVIYGVIDSKTGSGLSSGTFLPGHSARRPACCDMPLDK